MPKPKLNLQNVSSALDTPSTTNQTASRISSTLQQLQQPSRNIFRIGNIPLENIKRNEKNEYPIIEIEKLEASILVFGLIETLSVHYLPDENIYELENGERRFTAIKNLIERYSSDDVDKTTANYKFYRKNVEQFAQNGIPCKIENEAHSLYSEARLIIANSEKRPDDPVFQSKMTNRLVELYTLINAELPAEERFSINQKIAEDLNLSTRQVMRNKQFGSLTPNLQNMLIKDKGINEGSRYHVLSKQAQEQLAKDIQETGIVPDLETAKKLYDTTTSSDFSSPNSKSEPKSAIALQNEKISVLTKEITLKKSLKSLKKSFEKTIAVWNEYKIIDADDLNSLNLKSSSTYKSELLTLLNDFESLL